MVRKLTQTRTRRRLKNRSKRSHSRNNKYKKTRSRKYIKNRRNMTRRRVLRGGAKPRTRERVRDIMDIDLSEHNKQFRFRDLVDALENNPSILMNGDLQTDYKNMIELKDGYIGLTGLKFINYLWERIIELYKKEDKEEYKEKYKEKYENLQEAISLMDQNAVAMGITCDQLSTIQSITKDQDVNYYCCYLKLFNELAHKLRIVQRHIPLSTSACHIPCSSIVIEKGVDLEGVDPGCKLKDYKRRRFEG